MKNGDAIYSYVERKMIDSNTNKITFDPNRHKKNDIFTVSDLLKKILLYGSIILIICGFTFYPTIAKHNKKTQDFIVEISSIVHESNDIMNTIITEYNNNNFSTDYKTSLQNKLTILQSNNLDDYTTSKYGTLTIATTQILNNTIDSINIILYSSTADSYNSGALNANLKSYKDNIDIYNKSLFQFFDDNGIFYKFNSDGSYTYNL